MSRITMSKYAWYVAAALVLAPGLALAQTADPNHLAPGAGSRIPEVMRTTEQPLSAYQTDLSIPGDGYRIVAVPRTITRPLAAYPTDAGIPGNGYRIN
jgi:hypothetical protein